MHRQLYQSQQVRQQRRYDTNLKRTVTFSFWNAVCALKSAWQSTNLTKNWRRKSSCRKRFTDFSRTREKSIQNMKPILIYVGKVTQNAQIPKSDLLKSSTTSASISVISAKHLSHDSLASSCIPEMNAKARSGACKNSVSRLPIWDVSVCEENIYQYTRSGNLSK